MMGWLDGFPSLRSCAKRSDIICKSFRIDFQQGIVSERLVVEKGVMVDSERRRKAGWV